MTVSVGPERISARTMSYRSVRKNCNGQLTTERIVRLHDAEKNARNDHKRSDADQNLAEETRAIGDDATAVLRIFSGRSDRGRARVRSPELWPRTPVKSLLSVRHVHAINPTQL